MNPLSIVFLVLAAVFLTAGAVFFGLFLSRLKDRCHVCNTPVNCPDPVCRQCGTLYNGGTRRQRIVFMVLFIVFWAEALLFAMGMILALLLA